MGISVKNGVPSFFQKLKVAEKDLPQYCADKVAQEGYDIANALYGGDAVNVWTNSVGEGESEIIATGVGLLYKEYGTGEQGRDSHYPEEKQYVQQDFYSNSLHEQVHLDKWTYSYAHEKNPAIPLFQRGQKAGMQMLNTSLELRREYAKNIKE